MNQGREWKGPDAWAIPKVGIWEIAASVCKNGDSEFGCIDLGVEPVGGFLERCDANG